MPPVFDSHAYQSYQRQRQMTLGDLLLENRIVFLQGEIYTGNANEVVMKLLYLQSENRRKDIHFYLNSPGGEVVSTLAIYDTMQMLSCPVATYCVGQAASGAAVLLAGGAKGKRYCLPNSTVMFTSPMAVFEVKSRTSRSRQTRSCVCDKGLTRSCRSTLVNRWMRLRKTPIATFS